MCGISGILGPGLVPGRIEAMVRVQGHRGPDDTGLFFDEEAGIALGHNRLSILDLSSAGRQPMATPDARYRIVFNGEVYNYLELRRELTGYPFRSATDSEVVLAAYARWGEAALKRFAGMFAFAIWDARERRLFAARDRFGVKPFHYQFDPDEGLLFASEPRALFAAGVRRDPDEASWAAYLAYGRQPAGGATFLRGIKRLPAGCSLTWERGRLAIRPWYDLAARIGGELDPRPEAEVREELVALLERSVALRFRSDVPVGINLSGGLDSSLLLGLVHAVEGADSEVSAFTFACGDEAYDELPWVRRMLERTRHPSVVCTLTPEEVPELARAVHEHEEEPFGGLPTLAYAKLFETARSRGVKVLLDGQGMDEQWAGYDYYRRKEAGTVQGTRTSPVRPECLVPEFAALAARPVDPDPFPDRLRNLQLRDLCRTKLPRALRFNDRVSMRASCELREPFLDHRLVELALRQPAARKLGAGRSKRLLRDIAGVLLPEGVVEAPKRPLQTPQREWLRGPLRAWSEDCIATALHGPCGDWFAPDRVRRAAREFFEGRGDNSFFLWQWLSLAFETGSRLEAVA